MRTIINAAHGQANGAGPRRGMRIASTSASAIVAFLIATTPAGALANTGQAAGESELPSDALPVAQSDEEIVVTGSRITRSGFEAPTPTTMVGTADIARQGAPNIAAVLNQVPSFLPSSTPATAGNNSTNVGGNFLNLRGLGATRTLVLVNGRRHVPTTPNGLVDVNLIPQALIERVEVVTGGASAAWGSDAVAGVVNFILNDNLEGFQGSAQMGIAEEGDNREYRAALAYGTSFADGRGHIAVAGEIFGGQGIVDQSDRDWGRDEWQVITNPAFAPGNGQPAQLVARDVHQANRTEGGLITSGPLAGTQFLPGGVPVAFRYGSPRNAAFMVGGDGINQGLYTSLIAPVDRQTISTIATYEISDSIRAVVEGTFGTTQSLNAVTQPFSTRPYTIQADNAFLPESLRAQLAPGSTFQLGRINTDFGFIVADTTVKAYRAVAALEGDFGDSWKWSTYYQYGKTRYDGYLNDNVIVANLDRAMDAVRNPAGQIVCRSTLTNPTNGCVPLNVFGYGSPSDAALNYIHGRQELLRTIRQDALAADLQGEPFSTWAGPVSLAVGAEYRKETADVEVDAISQAGGYMIGNPKALTGGFNVKEAFGEILVPLLADLPFAKSLDVNGAVRFTDYSTTGSVTTWKAGLSYELNDSLRFRATRSRDIRAPNLDEVFSPSSILFTTIRDPRDGSASLINVNVAGNPDLRPEKADTLTLGVVFDPAFAPGLRASVDYYDIKVKGAIRTLGTQDIIDRCFGGATELCQYVIRNPAGAITNVVSSYFNIAALETSGLDFELSYTTPLDRIVDTWSGTLRARLLGTWVDKLTTSDGVTTIDRSGEVGPNNGGVPEWRLSANLGYEAGPVAVSLTGLYLSSGKYDNALVEGVGIDDNSIPSRFYVNGSVEFTVLEEGRQRVQIFGVVNNLFDRDPPIAPSTFQNSLATNNALYDVIGRNFVAGVRFAF